MENCRHLASETAIDEAVGRDSVRELVERLVTAQGDTSVDDCLEGARQLLGADVAAIVLERGDGTSAVVHVRASRRTMMPLEDDDIAWVAVRQALDSDSEVVWDRTNQSEPSSISSLAIYAALVAPLRVSAARGALYFDFRYPGTPIELSHQRFLSAAVALLGAIFERRIAAGAARERAPHPQSQFPGHAQTPSLDELLRPRSMARVREQVAMALCVATPVLIVGESGSGKTVLAQALAQASGRSPIVRVVLGASDDLNTMASELFGHERGAFSGAMGKRVGLFEHADGGTVILDEVLNMPLHAQKLLLDYTQFGTYRPLGYDKPQPKRACTRIFAASNGNLRAAIRDGRFREDLYHRLAGITLRMPPLRDRREDIPALAEHVLLRIDGSRPWTLSVDARWRLSSNAHAWPGNVRELEWLVQRARERALARDAVATEIGATDVVEALEACAPDSARLHAPLPCESLAEEWKRLQECRAQVEQREADVLREALRRHQGVVARAATELGVARTTLAGRARSLGVGERK